MTELPRGTVTFVFTDVEDSTALLKTLGDRYADVLRAHRRIVREAFVAADGIEMDTQGDAFFFVFPRARDAVSAAVRAQRAHVHEVWPAGVSVRVRIGLHTGEPAVHEEGYVGLDVVRAARICTLGHGGQILLSESTRALLGSTLPEGASVFPLGQRHLRGIDEPERVFEVALDDVAGAPPSADQPRTTAVEAPSEQEADSEAEFERALENLGTRMSSSIQDAVLRSLESRLVGVERPDDEDRAPVDAIAARMRTLGAEIDARVRAHLRAHGMEGDEPDAAAKS